MAGAGACGFVHGRNPVFYSLGADKERGLRVTDKEAEQIASAVAEKMKLHVPKCQVFTVEEVCWFHNMFDFCKQSRVTALATLVGFLVLGLLGLVFYGIVHKIKTG